MIGVLACRRETSGLTATETMTFFPLKIGVTTSRRPTCKEIICVSMVMIGLQSCEAQILDVIRVQCNFAPGATSI